MKNERVHPSDGCVAYVKVKQPAGLNFCSSESTFCFVMQHCGADCQVKAMLDWWLQGSAGSCVNNDAQQLGSAGMLAQHTFVQVSGRGGLTIQVIRWLFLFPGHYIGGWREKGVD